eukprot:9478125-Pyramimonas_sp.AAC.1
MCNRGCNRGVYSIKRCAIASGCYEFWKHPVLGNYNELKEFIATDQLPMSYGGTLGGLSSDALLAVLEMQTAK